MNISCKFVKSNKEPCQARCMTNSDYCYWHNPDVAVKRAEARKKGGQNRRAGKQSNHGRYSIKTVGEVLKALEDALNDAINLENSHARARTIGYLCQISLKALEVGELERRLEALEQSIFQKGGKHNDS